MAKDTQNNAADSKIEFIQSHRPTLSPGNYTVTVTQEIEAKNQPLAARNFSEKFPAAILNFSISGPRFTLSPQDIQAIFPPAGSLGDHANVLPHIILNRSTLPWERSTDLVNQETSWLALLLFEEEEVKTQVTVHSLTVADLRQSGDKFPQWQQELGDHGEDTLTVIDVDKTLLQAICPTKTDLQLLAHVRQTQEPNGKSAGDEVAVIICNRLPKVGQMSIVHLVSMEGRYPRQAHEFHYPETEDKVRLVSLTNWQFSCVDQRQNFKGLLMHLNHQLLFNILDVNEKSTISNDLTQGQIPLPLIQAFAQNKPSLDMSEVTIDCVRWKITHNTGYYLITQPPVSQPRPSYNVYNQAGRWLFKLDSVPAKVVSEDLSKKLHIPQNIPIESIEPLEQDHWWINTNQYLVAKEANRLYVYHLDPDRFSTLRLPPLNNAEPVTNAAESYLKMGCVPLSHAMRQGNKTVSWYHGPLVPGGNTTAKDFLPVRSADDLVLYNSDYGMFDVSYSAAWELGRLLAIQSKSFSVSLYNWKRTHAQMSKDAEQQLNHLPLDASSAALDLPQAVSSWFEHLALLEGVPFNYLVPDERLLPAESIRFFQLDPRWMECLVDGAFSIGRVSATNHQQDASHRNKGSINVSLPAQVSGFLLRSDVVAGWPGLQVDGYAEAVSDTSSVDQTKKLQRLRMASLSKNVLICLFDGIVKTVDLHLKPETLHFGLDRLDKVFSKKLRNRQGQDNGQAISISWKDEARRAINLASMASEMQTELQKIEPSKWTAFTSAEFALEMIEGVEKVRFSQKTQ